MTKKRENRIEMPVLALRDVVVYPHMVIPLFVGREKSIRCLEAAMDKDKQIFLVAQKDAAVDEPEVADSALGRWIDVTHELQGLGICQRQAEIHEHDFER